MTVLGENRRFRTTAGAQAVPVVALTLFSLMTGAMFYFRPAPVAADEVNGAKEMLTRIFSSVLVPPALSDDAAVSLALDALRAAAKDELGIEPEVKYNAETAGAGAAAVVLRLAGDGAPGDESRKTSEKLSPEGFRIEPSPAAQGGLTVAAAGPSAAAHALFFIADRLRIDPTALFQGEIVREPAFKLRIASGCSPDDALRWGYNAILMRGVNHNRLVLLDSFDPELFTGRRDYLDEIAAARARAAELIERSHALHIDPITSGDEFEFHRAVLSRPYRGEIAKSPTDDFLCFCSDTLWEMYSAKYRELLSDFPGLRFVMIRLGENYASGNYFGNVTATKEFWRLCPRCAGVSYEKQIAEIIGRTWRSVSGEHGAAYIHRSWETYDKGFHSDPKTYAAIVKRLKPMKDLYISVKYTATDFWRYNFPNPTIGLSGPPQIVEFQCQREYEGKGAYPNFIGEETAEAYRYIRDRGAAGAWNWLHGGGWNGPYVKEDWWNEANIYAASRLAWEPGLPAARLAREWAALRFGAENADSVARILLLSDDAVEKLVYFKVYAERKSTPWIPNENWVRDDVIKGAEPLALIYLLAGDAADEMIAEKDEAVAIIEEMLAIANDLNLAERPKQFITDSIRYELLLARTLRHYAAAYFKWCRWKDTADAADKAEALDAWRSWKQNWDAYNAAVPRMSLAASPYLDDGMTAAMDAIYTELFRPLE